jgi:hypothetical protein
MTMSGATTRAAAVSALLLATVFTASGVDVSAGASARAEARQSPQDLAGKLSGTWVLNRDLSSGFGAPGRGRGEPRPRALFAAAAAAVPQRGGGGGRGGGASDASDLTPEQRAEQAAMRQLQQIADRMTIQASADSVTFTDQRGDRAYAVNDKTSTLDVGGSPVKVRSKWDKRVLKQEFSNNQGKLVETWAIDETDHLVLTAKVESLSLVTPDRKAVFDRR